MDKETKQFYKNIKNGTNLEQSVPKYLNSLSFLYKSFAEINFTMNYFMFYENFIESYSKMNENQLRFLDRLNTLINKYFLEQESYKKDKSLGEIKSLRDDIIEQMKILTNYADVFEVYEYVLERLKPRYEESLKEIDDDLYINQITNFIFEAKEQVDIKSRLSDVISQLPVRMSRYKFFDLIDNSFSIFRGESPSSLESYIYVLRTNALLYKPKGMDETYEELEAFRKKLEAVNYNDLGQEEFKSLYENLSSISSELFLLTDYYYGLQEVINNLFVYLLNTNGNRDTNETPTNKIYDMAHDSMFAIVEDVSNHYKSKDLLEVNEEIVNLLNDAVGIQEELLEGISQMESVFVDTKIKYDSILKEQNLDNLYNYLEDSQKFFSNSLFFEVDKVEDNRVLKDSEINEVKANLLIELEELFRKNSKYVNRGVIAKTLSNLPMVLTTKDEIEEYVNNSLTKCRDLAEKTASINMIQAFWE